MAFGRMGQKLLSRPGAAIVRVAFPMFQIHIEVNPVLGKRLLGIELLDDIQYDS